jgi:hypothetical protein
MLGCGLHQPWGEALVLPEQSLGWERAVVVERSSSWQPAAAGWRQCRHIIGVCSQWVAEGTATQLVL